MTDEQEKLDWTGNVLSIETRMNGAKIAVVSEGPQGKRTIQSWVNKSRESAVAKIYEAQRTGEILHFKGFKRTWTTDSGEERFNWETNAVESVVATEAGAEGPQSPPPPQASSPSGPKALTYPQSHEEAWRAIEMLLPRIPDQLEDAETRELRDRTPQERERWLLHASGQLIRTARSIAQAVEETP